MRTAPRACAAVLTEPLSTLFYLPPNPNVAYSAALMENAEKMFMTGKAPYPVERTLLTSGMVEAALQGQVERRYETAGLFWKLTCPAHMLFNG